MPAMQQLIKRLFTMNATSNCFDNKLISKFLESPINIYWEFSDILQAKQLICSLKIIRKLNQQNQPFHFLTASEQLSHLELICAGLAAHHVAAGAERSVYLLLAAQHAQQGLSELLQSLLQGPALLAATAVQPLVLLVVSARGAWRRGAFAAARAGHQVHDARVVEGAACVVVHFLGGTSDVEDILLAQVDVFIEEKRS